MSANIDAKRVAPRRRELFPALGGAVAAIVARTLAWRDRARQRRALLRLDDRLLRDIGLTRCDVQSEAGKPFWLP